MMASPAAILLGCLLLSAVLGSQVYHLKLTVVRRSGNEYCAEVRCTFDADDENDVKFNTKRITIFDITQPITRGKVASISENESLYIDLNRLDEITGKANISKYHGDLALNLKDPNDCRDELFQCEVEFLNSQGIVEVIHKSITTTTETGDDVEVDHHDTSPTIVTANENNTNCPPCSLRTYQFQRLHDMAREAERKLDYFTEQDVEFTDQLALLSNDSKITAEELARLEHKKAIQEEAINNFQKTQTQEKIDSMRHNDAAVNQQVEVMRKRDQAKNEDLALLQNRDKENDREIGDLKGTDKLQEEALNNISHSQSVTREYIDQLRQQDLNFDSELKELYEKNKEFMEVIVKLTDKARDLDKQMDVVSKTDKTINQGLDGLRKSDAVINGDLRELAKKEKELLEETAKLKHTNQIIQDDLVKLLRFDNDHKEQIDTLKRNNDVFAVEITFMKSRDGDFRKNIGERIQTDESLQKQLDDLKVKDDSTDVELNNLKGRSNVHYENLSALKVKDRFLDEQITSMFLSGDALEVHVNKMWSQHRIIDEGLVVLSARVSDIEHFINSSLVTTETRTTTNLVLKECTREMVHDQPRARFLLHGSIPALCDTKTDGGGWVIIQRRTVGDLNFFRDWNQYKKGFGNPSTDFYLGNDIISNLTKHGYTEMRLEMEFKGAKYFAHYLNFKVASEASHYKLSVRGYNGTAGDAMTYHNEMEFTTFDRDNDKNPGNCATKRGGGWWYNSCYRANLNGRWGKKARDGVIWDPLSDKVPLTMTQMMVRLVV